MNALRIGEAPALALSFLYFLLLLASYYIVRPVRDALIAGLGVAEIKYLTAAVFFVMLAIAPVFGALMKHWPRHKLLPAIYGFFALNLACFAIAFESPHFGPWPARIFYVWLMVFNMFVVSVFWSFMADIWREEQGRRLFGAIAAGGSVGGLLGPLLAQRFVGAVGNSGLMWVAALLLSATIVCIVALHRISHASPRQESHARADAERFSNSSWQGIALISRSPFLLGIAGLVLIGAIVAQFAYSETARLAKELIATPEARTIFFARIDGWTNAVALVLQSLIVGPLSARLGIVAPMLGLPLIGLLAFGSLAVSPTLATLGASNVARRAAEFGLGKPGRDMLYTVATPQEKYLAKNVIDTVISRGGDLVGSWCYSAIAALGIALTGMSWIAMFAILGAIGLALSVVRGYRSRGGK